MLKPIDLNATLLKLNDFAHNHGLPKNNFQRVWVEGNKLMAEHTQKKSFFKWPWAKPESPSSQIWISLDENGEPIPTALKEHTVVVFKTAEIGHKAQIHMQQRDNPHKTECLAESYGLFYSDEAFRLWFKSVRESLKQPGRGEQWLFVFDSSEYWDADYQGGVVQCKPG